jgi:hypothetical protein
MIATGVELMMKMSLRLLGKYGVGVVVMALKYTGDVKEDKGDSNHDDEDLGGMTG